MLLKIKS